MSFEIRKGLLSDLPYVYEICLHTGYRGTDAQPYVSDSWILGQLFAAPYLVRDTKWCWIVTMDERPVGYLLGTPDSADYYRWMNAEWLPALRKIYAPAQAGEVGDFEAIFRRMIHEDSAPPPLDSAYSGHFHIDLLPPAQGKGLGSSLVAAFETQLRSEAYSGYHLGVDASNEKALIFYGKQGLRELSRAPGVVFMGKRSGLGK